MTEPHRRARIAGLVPRLRRLPREAFGRVASAPARQAIRAAALALALAPGWAASGEPVRLSIGHVALEDDPRYRGGAEHAGIAFRTLGPALPGARLGIEDATLIGDVIDVAFDLRVASAPEQALPQLVRGWAGDGVRFVVADLPRDALLRLADGVADLPVLIFNATASDDALRNEDCRANLVHTLPSDAMRTDALVQYLMTKGWRRVLILRGEADADARLARALRRSAGKFGATVVAERDFALTVDPRRREDSNVSLMTADAPDHDVVFVADASGEFDRYVPYQTARPRPVVGTAGLSAHAWHWSWDRHGAPQLQHRFEALAPPRRMNDGAWAAWAAVRAVTQAAMRSDPADFAAMRAHLTGDALRVDGSKGAPMNLRPWNGQMRQPVLLATPDATIAVAPLEPFLHRLNDLDTLGRDAPESGCATPPGAAP